MGAVVDKRAKVRDGLEQDIPYLFNYSVRLLSLVQRIAKLRVYGNNIIDVPEDLLQKVCAPRFWDDV